MKIFLEKHIGILCAVLALSLGISGGGAAAAFDSARCRILPYLSDEPDALIHSETLSETDTLEEDLALSESDTLSEGLMLVETDTSAEGYALSETDMPAEDLTMTESDTSMEDHVLTESDTSAKDLTMTESDTSMEDHALTESDTSAKTSAAAESVLDLYAQSAVLMDGGSGRILYDKNGNTPLPMASTTKIMTCILALEYMEEVENVKEGESENEAEIICTVSSKAASQPEVKLGMTTGDTYALSDLLYSLMLESHNDTAVCIAETVSGSVEAFAARMNAKAAEIGCTQTYYITPNGLDAEDENGIHHTTAHDLALVMRYCLTESSQSARFLEITQTASYTFSNIEGTHTYSCTNHNAFLNLMEGAISGKTGFTGNAGYCYVGALERDGKLLIVALLACGWPNNKGYKWVDTKKLMNYGLSEFELVDITNITGMSDGADMSGGSDTNANRSFQTADVLVTNGQQGKVTTVLKEIEPTEVLMRADEQVEIRVEELQTLEAPVSAGTQVGLVHYLVDGTEYAVAEIVTAAAVEERTYLYCLRKLMKAFLERL